MSESNISVRKKVPYLLERLVAYAVDDRWIFVLVIVGTVFVTLTNTALIWLLGKPLSLIQTLQYDALWYWLLILVGVLLANQSVRLLNIIGFNWLALSYIGRLRAAVLQRVLAVSFPATMSYQRGDLLARLSNDVDRAENFVVEIPLGLVSHFTTMCFFLTMLFWINVQLALIACFFLPLFYFHQFYFAPRKGKAAALFFKKNGELIAFEEQSLGNLRGISSFNAERVVGGLHESAYGIARKWSMKMRNIDAWYSITFNLITYGCGIVVVAVGIEYIQSGKIMVGQLVSFLLYLGYISVPVNGFAQAPIQWRGDQGAAIRVLELLDLPPVVADVKDAKELKVDHGEITLVHVDFAYPGGTPIFTEMNATIKGGETLALVGGSGSGKTSFARLLMRFFDPQRGSIKIDNTDIRDVTLESLRKNIAVVWQDPFLINATIAENLRFANPLATDQQLEDACRAANAWDFISALDNGLGTTIGTGGIDLSGGQKQRLSIAQAFIRDTPILIMDEASSALDSHSEKAIVEALNLLRKDRTTLIIAHRYSSIRTADRVMYFTDNGHVTLHTHDELMNSSPQYNAAVAWQTEGKTF